MKIVKTLLELFGAALLGFPLFAAASSVTSTSGSFAPGQAVNINGTGFGAKGGTNPNKPLIWADLSPKQTLGLHAWVRDVVVRLECAQARA